MRSLSQDNRISRYLIIALFSIVAMIPAYWNGVPSGNDNAQHFQFVSTVYESIINGDLVPHVAGKTNRGLGDVGLRFYPPLAYYEIAIVYLAVGDWYVASLIAFTLVMFVGGLGMFLWAREAIDANSALMAAAIYILAPYHLNQIYNNFLLGEFFASAVVPYCFLYLTRLCDRGDLRTALKLAVAFSILILTHIPMTVLTGLAMMPFAMLMSQPGRRIRTIGMLAIAGSASLTITSFQWLRIITELDWVKHSDPAYFSGIWNFRQNFLLVPDQIINFSDDILNLWFADVLLVAMLAITLPTIVYFVREKRTRFLTSAMAVLAIAVFMTTPASVWIWEYTPILGKVQFPWRWLLIVAAFAAVTAPYGLTRAAKQMQSSNNIFLTIGVGLCLFLFVFTIAFIPRGTVYTTREQIQMQMTDVSNSEGCECWWPAWSTRSALAQNEKVVAGERTVRIDQWTATRKSVYVGPGHGQQATFASFYYPHWHAESNGAAVAVEPSSAGTIAVDIPEHEVELELNFVEPRSLVIAKIVSIFSFILTIGALAVMGLRKRRKDDRRTEVRNLMESSGV